FLEWAGVPVWEVEPAHADRFLGQAQRHQAVGTRRGKAKAIDLFFRFPEARYRGEIHELTGRVVASPIDDCNRPRHSGDFQGLVPMLGDARPLLVWWVQEVRGQFTDDWELPRAVVFPSERGGPIGGDTFATALSQAASQHLRGPVTKLTPHVLRHACASRLYAEGIGLAAIQQLLGHRWLSTTVRYVHVADEAIESAYQQAAERAAARFKE